MPWVAWNRASTAGGSNRGGSQPAKFLVGKPGQVEAHHDGIGQPEIVAPAVSHKAGFVRIATISTNWRLPTMKNVFLWLVFAVVTAGPAYAEAYSEQHEKVQSLFQSDEEPTTKDALWTARDIFNVAVIDDGSHRDGYAQHVCEVLYEYGFKGKGVWVQVIDVVERSDQGKWKELGSARCQ